MSAGGPTFTPAMASGSWSRRARAAALVRIAAVAVLAMVVLAVVATPAAGGQPEHETGAAADAHADQHGGDQPAAPGHVPAEEHHEAAAEHAESPWAAVWRVVNFVLLVGALWYFLRAPLTNYFTTRGEQIQTELTQAEATRAAATASLAELEARMRALPGEIEALRRRGSEETTAEEARIREQAAAERERLLEQMRREIETRMRAARRELAEYAAELSVEVARDRLAAAMTPDDQMRLIDRYVDRVERARE